MFKKIIMLLAVISASQAWASDSNEAKKQAAFQEFKKQLLKERTEDVSHQLSVVAQQQGLPEEKKAEIKGLQSVVSEALGLLPDMKKKDVELFLEKWKKSCDQNENSGECALRTPLSAILTLDRALVVKELKERRKVLKKEYKALVKILKDIA